MTWRELAIKAGRETEATLDPPTIDDFLTRYPEFVGYDAELVQLVLDDSNMRIAEGAWTDHDRAEASMALTAHRLVTTPGAAPSPWDEDDGSGGSSPPSGASPGAVKSRTVGDVRVEYETKSDYIKGSGGGSVSSGSGPLADFYLTPYGRYYLYLMKLNFPAVAVVYR
jgi:hypothetical protein